MSADSDRRAPRGRRSSTPSARLGRLRRGLFILGVLFTLVAVGTVALSIVESREEAIADAEQQSQNLARALERHTSSAFSGVDVALDDIEADMEGSDNRLPADRLRWHELLKARRALLPQVRNFSILDETGGALADASSYPAPALDASERDYFKTHRNDSSRESLIGAPIKGLLTGRWLIPVSRRIDRPDGAFGGVVLAIVEPGYFGDLYKTLDIGADGAFAILDKNGALLAREPFREELFQRPPAMSALLEALKKSPQGTYLSAGSPIDGVVRIISYRTVEIPPLIVTVGVSLDQALARWKRASLYEAGIAMAVTALFWLLIAALMRNLRDTARTAESLERAEINFRSIYENATEGIYQADPQGRLRRANPAFVRMCGYDSEEALVTAANKPDFAWYVDPTARSRFYAVLTAEGRIENFESELHRHKPKGTFWASENSRAVKDGHGNVLYIEGTAVDITARKRAEEARLSAVRAEQQAERRLADAIESISEGVVLYDSNERFVMCNSTYRTFFTETLDIQTPGTKYEDILRAAVARGQFDLPPGIDPESYIQDRLAKFRGTGETIVRQNKDGRWIQISERRTPDGGVIRVITDITGLKRNEEARLAAHRRERQAENRLIDAIESISEGIILFDAEERFVLCNSRHRVLHPETTDLHKRYNTFEQLLRASVERRQIALPRGIDPENFIQTRLRQFRNPGEPIERQLVSGRWVSIAERRTPDGGVIRVTTDITPIKRHEEALVAAKEAAEAANHSKSVFLANMSHELRTPLHAILGLSEMVRDQAHGKDAAPYAQYGRLIHDSGQHLLTLISDILDMSKIEAGRYELNEDDVALGALVANCVSIVATRAKTAGVAVSGGAGEGGPVVRADRRAVTQVLLNLLSNGIKFTPSGGHVSVSTAVEPSGSAVLHVRDTGIGIAPEHMDRVMEPFAQIDPSHARKYEGTGLGLSISRRLMELHGGAIELASTPGRGVTATVRFPKDRTVRIA